MPSRTKKKASEGLRLGMTPREAAEYVYNIRLAEAMFGDGIKRAMPCEESMLRYRVTGTDVGTTGARIFGHTRRLE